MRLKSRPVAALELMVDLYLDPEIASPRKVSVWYAFWGEASSRQEYYDICGQKDESFAALVRELIERMIVETSQPQLDPDGIALGLIGVLEMLWQDFAFRAEADIDRVAAKRRVMAYLRSIFPGQFAPAPSEDGTAATDRRPAGWVYANERLFASERDAVFQESWQLVADQAQIPRSGDFLAVDLGVERVLIVRDAAGQVRAFRNSCSKAPHILLAAPAGHVDFIRCAVHGLQFELDGGRRGALGSSSLLALNMRMIGGLIFVRPAGRASRAVEAVDPWIDFSLPPGARFLAPAAEIAVAADWKLVIEQWLESSMIGGSRHTAVRGWSARAYRHVVGSAADFHWHQRFLAPNHLVELRPDGLSLLQALPSGAGRSLLRRHDFTLCTEEKSARIAGYLASRLNPYTRPAAIAVAESTQKGMVTFGREPVEAALTAPAAAAFRRQLAQLVPMMTLARPPHDG
jgi:phenylpropionate dioxygenase-like ring-hydroxylating dioxygenase large terminal subunit